MENLIDMQKVEVLKKYLKSVCHVTPLHGRLCPTCNFPVDISRSKFPTCKLLQNFISIRQLETFQIGNEQLCGFHEYWNPPSASISLGLNLCQIESYIYREGWSLGIIHTEMDGSNCEQCEEFMGVEFVT